MYCSCLMNSARGAEPKKKKKNQKPKTPTPWMQTPIQTKPNYLISSKQVKENTKTICLFKKSQRKHQPVLLRTHTLAHTLT